MASSDFIDNAISSKVDESAVNDLASALESSISNPPGGPQQQGQRMIVRTTGAGQVTTQGQQVIRQAGVTTMSGQVIRTASGQMVMANQGQRIIQQPGGQQVLMARPQGGQIQGQQLVRTSTGQLLQVGGQQVQQRPQQLGQQVIRQVAAPGQPSPGQPGMAGVQRVVINQPGLRPGQPGAQITVPLSTLQALQAGQGIPTGQPGHLLVKTETGQYQILRVGPPGAMGTTQAQPVTVAPAPQQPTTQQQFISPSPSPARAPIPIQRPPQPSPQPRLPTQPVARPQQPQATQQASAAASLASNNSMGQQMTPDTAKIKCKNFLATLLRLASDQPESVARNVRALIQGLIDGRVEPELFTTKLQKELNSSPQPCLVPFLKKSLPYLQQSLAQRELTIEGVNPPRADQVGRLPPPMSLNSPSPSPSPAPSIQQRPPQQPQPTQPTRITMPQKILYSQPPRPPRHICTPRGPPPGLWGAGGPA